MSGLFRYTGVTSLVFAMIARTIPCEVLLEHNAYVGGTQLVGMLPDAMCQAIKTFTTTIRAGYPWAMIDFRLIRWVGGWLDETSERLVANLRQHARGEMPRECGNKLSVCVVLCDPKGSARNLS